MGEASYQGYATGAVRHEPSDSDYVAHKIAHVAAAMAEPLPETVFLSGHVHTIYDQGQIPACVFASSAAMKSIQDDEDRMVHTVYNVLDGYHACGGNDREGLPARDVLEYMKTTGLLVEGGTARYRIGSYAFVKQDPALFVPTLKAAVAAGQPCVVALRLPEVFGWDSSGAPTEAYHQMCKVGFDSEGGGSGNAIFVNTWGPNWGKGGFCRIPFDYLTADNFQGGDCYAWTTIDAVDPSLAPDPPAPPPPEITVGGYLGATSSVPIVKAGAMLQIVGSGFLAPGLKAIWGDELEILDQQERLLTVRAPKTYGAVAAPIVIACGPVTVIGPLLVVVPSGG